jgi:hypothetical protein
MKQQKQTGAEYDAPETTAINLICQPPVAYRGESLRRGTAPAIQSLYKSYIEATPEQIGPGDVINVTTEDETHRYTVNSTTRLRKGIMELTLAKVRQSIND